MQLQKGQRIPLSNVLDTARDFQLRVMIDANFPIDVSIFALDHSEKLRHDDYMIFYNQPIAPNRVVSMHQENQQTLFNFDLNRLDDPQLEKFMLCASVDHASASMRDIQSGQIELCRQGQVLAQFNFKADLFVAEKAVMLAQIYIHAGTWRYGVVAQGFNGGLAALVEHFGASVSDSVEVIEPVAPTLSALDLKKKVILDKVIQASPRLLDLTKKSLISLEKNNLMGVVARVGLVLDRSGSMHQQYKTGDVQKVIDRVLPLAVNFDDNASFECWAFGEKTVRLDDVSLGNVNDYVNKTHHGWKKWKIGAAYNYEPQAIEKVIEYYQSFNDGIPSYIIFISDGGISEKKKISSLIRNASNLPIFWQFIGLGGRNYGILEELDNLTGRFIDNCNFFSLDNIDQILEEQLYDLLLQEFPLWLKQAKQMNIIRG